MSERRYTDEHEWVELDGDIATVGITDYAQQQLGDLVYVELPEVGKTLSGGDECATVESVKAASEVYAPLGGEIVEVNDVLADQPALVNEDAMGDGWFFKIKIEDEAEFAGLKDEEAYAEYLKELD